LRAARSRADDRLAKEAELILHDFTTYVFAGIVVGAGLGFAYFWEHYDTVRFDEPREHQFNEPQISTGVWRMGRVTDVIEPGMFVVFRRSEGVHVARVIATEGQHVEVQEKRVLVDGKPHEVHDVRAKVSFCDVPDMIVPRHCVFVLSDDRTRSGSPENDSRGLGPIRLEAVSHAFPPLDLTKKD
jgi:hypothetical protein